MDAYQKQAALLKVIAHPGRLHIADILRHDGECVCHLSAALGQSQPYVSQQLAIMREAGLVIDEKVGTNVFYRLADDTVTRQVAAILDAAGEVSAASRQAVAGCPCPKCHGCDCATPC